MDGSNVNRRRVIKSLPVGIGAIGSIGTAVAGRPRRRGAWKTLSATYDIRDARTGSETRVAARVTDRSGSIVTIRTEIDGETATYRLPVSAVQPRLRPSVQPRSRSGRGVATADDSEASVNRHESDGWYTEFSVSNERPSVGPATDDVERGAGIDFTVELVESSGVTPGRARNPLVLLPQIIPPNERQVAGRTLESDTETVESEVSTRDLTQYAHSGLTTIDNEFADLDTTITDVSFMADKSGSWYDDIDYDIHSETFANWSKDYHTVTDEYAGSSAKLMVVAQFSGVFPAGVYTHWRATHRHGAVFQDGSPDYVNHLLSGTIENRIPYYHSNYQHHKSETFANGTEDESLGSRESGVWYII